LLFAARARACPTDLTVYTRKSANTWNHRFPDQQFKNRRTKEGESAPMQPRLPIRICAYTLLSQISPATCSPQRSFYAQTELPTRRPAKETAGLPARFTASSVSSQGTDAEVNIVANLGEPLVDKGGKDWDLVGDAVHAYLGLPLSSLTEEMAKDDAERI